MDGEEIPTCGEGQHDWKMNENKETECEVCYAIADADFVFGHMDYLEVDNNNHSRKLDDALKAAREAPKAQGIVWDNLEPIDYNLNTDPSPKITTVVPTLRIRIECDETDTTYEEYEE